MASSHDNIHTEAAKMEQISTEFFTKSFHIILESRSPYMSSRNRSGEQIVSSPSSSSSSTGVRRRDKCYNFAPRECPAVLENIDLWRHSNLESMVVDVMLVHRPLDWDHMNYSPKRDFARNLSSKEWFPFSRNSDQEELGCEAKSDKIIERWVVQYETRRSRDCGSGSRRSSNTLQILHKKLILLLRSLYTIVRLLPAYKIFRELNSSRKIHTYTLSHRVSSFVEPLTRKEESEMQTFGFSPVDTSCGRLCLSVLYRSLLSDVSSESSTLMSPQFIPDYVGSPLANPLKRFPLLPGSHDSPSSLPFSRPHSWSYDLYKASPPSISFLPSPSHSEPHTSISNPSSRCFPPMNLPPHPPETSSVHKKNTSFDECCPCPNFTPFLSPSPPICIPGSHVSKALLRSGSAPVRIPAVKLSSSPVISGKQNCPPSPPIKGARSDNPKTDKSAGLVQTGGTIEKLFSLGKDENRKCSGAKLSSNGSPQISISRSSSRSFPDDFDDPEFPCPFDVEDDDMMDLASRKSQDAAVSALVRLLNKAPLRQEFSSSGDFSQDSRPKMWSSNFPEDNQICEALATLQGAYSSVVATEVVTSKTTADALEEFRGYKGMRDLLLGRSGRSIA